MAEAHKCPSCGAELPPDVLDGLCPRCLAHMAFGRASHESKASSWPLNSRVPPETQTFTALLPVTEKAGDKIGHYKLLQQIGEGGCGVVYMAEQEEPIRRRVAFKVIKLGMDTKQVIARFEAERQALALMDHPNIAKVLDAGATDTGRPYFVMELVRGIKITDYCDRNNLPTEARLDLFMQVCHAVQHAHQKGIIHRDIKPSNILVTLHDGKPVPKVIDFGIAKATEQKLTEKTLFTAFEQFIGTPAYMSPEQAEMSGLDIDTRSDIYSLGVLLYELLTDHTPFDAKTLLAAGLDGMRRIIREEEPVRPSTKISTLEAEEQTTVARRRQIQGPKLVHQVRGDLDWIVMKCLEKDRTRRYETANGLTNDLQRHLASEPVEARPPSNVYRFQKLVRRNKLAFAAAGAVTAALIIGLGLSTWLFFRERDSRLRAEKAEGTQKQLRQQAEANEEKAEDEASKSRQVAQFLKDMLEGVGPSKALGRDTTMLKEILDKTAERVGRDLTNQPEVEAELLATIGRTYYELGEYVKAEATQKEVLRLAKGHPGGQRRVAETVFALGQIAAAQDRMGEAEQLHREALTMRRESRGDVHPDVADSLDALAVVVQSRGDGRSWRSLCREALAIRQKTLSAPHPDLARSLHNMGRVLMMEGDIPGAEAKCREALAMRRQLRPQTHPELATSLNLLANLLRSRGEWAEAETTARDALGIRRQILPPAHPEIATSLQTLAPILYARDDLAEAETLFRRAAEMKKKLLGEAHQETMRCLADVARVCAAQDRTEEARALWLRVLELEPDFADFGLAALTSLESQLVKPELRALAPDSQNRPALWRYTLEAPAADWATPDFQDSGWCSGPAPFGSWPWMVRTAWCSNDLWLRREFTVDAMPDGTLSLRLLHDYGPAQIFLNGVCCFKLQQSTLSYGLLACSPETRAALKPGRNVLAVHGERQARMLIDIGLYSAPPGLRFGDRAIDAISQVLQAQPTNASLLRARANLFLIRHEWTNAIPDLLKSAELQPTVHDVWNRLVITRAAIGDVQAYQRDAHRMLERFGENPDPLLAGRTSDVCLLLPTTEHDFLTACKVADSLVTGEKSRSFKVWGYVSKAFADYRRGRYRDATEWLNKFEGTTTDPVILTRADTIRAMVRHKLNDPAEAKAALSRATETILHFWPPIENGNLGFYYFDWIGADILRREAQALIEGN
jgi:serine/threonine protein kinase